MSGAALTTFRRITNEPQPTNINARLLPHNTEAEESILGAMLLSRDAIATAHETLKPEDFYRPAHANIYEAILHLYSRGEPADPVTVANELTKQNLLDNIGGSGVLVALQAGTPGTTNAAHYAHIIEENSLLRKLITTCGDITHQAYNHPEEPTTLIDHAEQQIFNLTNHRTQTTLATLRDLIGLELDNLEQRYENTTGNITGLPTGYTDLDNQLNGLQPGALYIIGARPAMGKSAFALGIATHITTQTKQPCLLFSLEMSHTELTQRIITAEAQIDATRMRNGKLHANDWPKITQAIGTLAEAPLHIDDNPNTTIMEIRGKARRLKAKHGLACIIIDYIQLMTGKGRTENRQTEIAEISRGLKILARELEVPVIALSQLSRTLEQRLDKRPMLSDLRESGALEQDADTVLFLYRDEVYNETSPDRGLAEIIIAKQRSGPTGTIRLNFIAHHTRFANMTKGI
jgi:replicative DNA helicase